MRKIFLIILMLLFSVRCYADYVDMNDCINGFCDVEASSYEAVDRSNMSKNEKEVFAIFDEEDETFKKELEERYK